MAAILAAGVLAEAVPPALVEHLEIVVRVHVVAGSQAHIPVMSTLLHTRVVLELEHGASADLRSSWLAN